MSSHTPNIGGSKIDTEDFTLPATKADLRDHAKVDEDAIRAIHKRLDDIATKDDIAQLMAFMKNVKIGLGIFNFSWNNASKIGSFVIFLIAIFAIIKYGVFGAIAWFFGRNV